LNCMTSSPNRSTISTSDQSCYNRSFVERNFHWELDGDARVNSCD